MSDVHADVDFDEVPTPPQGIDVFHSMAIWRKIYNVEQTLQEQIVNVHKRITNIVDVQIAPLALQVASVKRTLWFALGMITTLLVCAVAFGIITTLK